MMILPGALAFVLLAAVPSFPQDPVFEQGDNTWVKRTPLPKGPPSPRLGYEGDCVWLPRHRKILRYGGHNQGGGGEQGSEIWLCDPFTGTWTLRHPNTSPPGVCCAQQNIYDPVGERYLRFPAFSASHGWQWRREIYLNGSAVWAYDVDANRWASRAPLPAPSLRALRCASWDVEHQVVVVFGGEGSREGTLVYDPAANSWTKMNPPEQPDFRSGGNMAYDSEHKVHVLFGAQFTDDPRTWIYDLRKNRWISRRPKVMPPTNQNDAVLTYDPVNRKILAIMKISEGKGEKQIYYLDTWSYDVGANVWTKMKPEREPTPTGNRCRLLMFAPRLNAAILENCPGRPREQQIWTYRYAGSARPKVQGPPSNVRLQTGTSRVVVTWKDDGANVEVFRGVGDTPWTVTFERIGEAKGGRFEDSMVEAGTLYTYFLRGAADSVKVQTRPGLVEQLWVAPQSPGEAIVSWAIRPEKDIIGYHVERATVEVYSTDELKGLRSRTPALESPGVGAIRKIGVFRRITKDPVTGDAYVDTTVEFGSRTRVEGETVYERSFRKDRLFAEGRPYGFTVYAYRVRSVNALGVLGGPSAAMLSIPSAPQNLFSREDGTTCRLKWKANPERGVQGYRVYRMKGRWDKDPIDRMTAEPIETPEYSDPEAGTRARRYYILAVDALGQEGYPSSPVWFEREWQKYYEPFVGEWHQ